MTNHSRRSARPHGGCAWATKAFQLLFAFTFVLVAGCGSGDADEGDYADADYADAGYADANYTDANYADGDGDDSEWGDAEYDDSQYAGSDYAPGARRTAEATEASGTEGRDARYGTGRALRPGAQHAESGGADPRGWRVYQDIATDPSTGTSARYQVDFVGPNDELIRNVRALNYFSMAGQSFDSAWQYSANQALQGTLERLEVGRLGPSEVLPRTRLVRELSQRVQVQALEAPVRGMRNGKQFAGVVHVVNMPTPQDPNSGTVMVEVLLAPAPSLEQLRQIHFQISQSREDNPQYQQAASQMSQQAMARDRAQSQQWMAQSQAAHQQRMASNQAQFDAHQQRMQSQSQSFDQMNQQWMSDFRSSGGSAWAGSGGDGYGSHEAFIDQIHGQQSFADPYSGQQMQMDGQYDYNYTNGLGDYYRTDDPNFDPNSLSGDWQAIDPMNPNQ